MATSPVELAPPRGVVPHLYFGGAWQKYPVHRWFVGTAWHYTSVAGLFGIVSNHELWASSAAMLNDVSEMSYGVERVREVASRWSLPPEGDTAAEVLIREAISRLDETMVDNAPFIFSASSSPLLLNQWANYGESSGCCVGFKALDTLHEEGQTGGFTSAGALPLWLEVIYEADAQDAYIHDLLDELATRDGLISQAIAHGHEPERLVTQNLAMLVAALKHPAFRSECEVRLLLLKQPTTKVHFRATPRGIVPFAKLLGTVVDPEEGVQYSTDPATRLLLPIVGVHVGPPQGDSENRRSASTQAFLWANGYDVHVSGAGIPYLP